MKDVELRLDSFSTVEPRYENYVSINKNTKPDGWGLPQIDIHFSFSERDLTAMQDLVREIKSVITAMNFKLLGSVCLLPIGRNTHDMGTCRMGDNPSNSTTNRYGQVHGIQGLFVAGNSVIPTSGAANPTLTTVALAIRTADYISNKYPETFILSNYYK